jgi:hypothetical protein
MQKKIMVMVVAAAMSGTAFGASSVWIGGRYDMGYQFFHYANADNANGTSNGGSTQETMGDGSASTSAILMRATEDLAPGWAAIVELDLRFGTIEEGKNTSTGGGITGNDRKALYLTSPYGNLRWGVMNLVNHQYWDYEERADMNLLKDLEIVKYGVSQRRGDALTSRTTEYDSPIAQIGPVKTRIKMSYAIGDSRKSGTSNINSTGSGDVWAVSETGQVGKWMNWGFSRIHKSETNEGVDPSLRNGIHYAEHYVNIYPIPTLKIAMNFNIYKGFGDAASTGSNGIFKEKNTNFLIAYNWSDKLQIGAARAHLNDLGSSRNSGRSWMYGASYGLSKSVYVFAARESDNYDRNDASGSSTKYSGVSSGFMTSWTKQDLTYTRIGLVKEF